MTYACREKADQPGSYAWTFIVPAATLYDAGKMRSALGHGPTWEDKDGSKVTGKQVAVSPAAAGNLPLQLVRPTRPAARESCQHDLHPAAEHGRRHSARADLRHGEASARN
ncbi:MAG: DUF3455 domain-containing protein [Betaproteobacteria bacterium]|nr:DUF3455 domain-containing protein [Candidatus Dechloromonas phosphorivorans]